MTTALVTGANRGIGLEVVRQLAAEGMTVILTARDMAKAQEATDSLKSAGLNVIPKAVDVADDASVRALAETVRAEFGQLDTLVNNARVMSTGRKRRQRRI